MSLQKIRVLAIGLLLSAQSFSASAADRYNVSMRLLHDGKVFSTPQMFVAADVESCIEIPGDGGYVLKLVVSDAGEGKFMLGAKLSSAFGNIVPTITATLGHPASVSNGTVEIEFIATRTSA